MGRCARARRQAARRRLSSTLRADVQTADLFYVVHAVEPVKLSPLGGGQRAENRVIEEFAVRPKFCFAARHHVIHFSNLGANLGQHLLHGNAARTSYGRGFPAGRKVAESQNDEGARPLPPSLSGGQLTSRLRRRGQIPSAFRCRSSKDARRSRQHTTFQEGARSTARATILRRTMRWLPAVFADEGPRGLLTFCGLSVRILREHKIHFTLSQEGCHEDSQPFRHGADLESRRKFGNGIVASRSSEFEW